MRRIALLITACCQVFWVAAQKKALKWMDKQRKTVATATIYGKGNQEKVSGTGFLIIETGEALSGYSLFKDAARATVTDADGEEYPVSRILGVDELYDVIKSKVEVPKKAVFLLIAREPILQGVIAYLMPYSIGKIAKFGEGPASEVNKLKEPFSYYKLLMVPENGWVNAPVLTVDGKVLGLVQEDAPGKKEDSCAVSAGYANSLMAQSADALNSTYSRIGIRKAWLSDVSQAQVPLYLMASSQGPKTHLATLNDSIVTFLGSPDGYLDRTNHYTYHRADLAPMEAEQRAYLDRALGDINTAPRFSEREGDIWFNRAKLIYGVAAADTTLNEEQWTVDVITEVIQKTIGEEGLPVYRQLEGNIHSYKGDFEQAFASYMKMNDSDMASSTSRYWTAKAKVNIRGANFGDTIVLLDSAIVKCGSPPTNEAAPYTSEWVDLYLKLMRYGEAVDDYDLYYDLLKGQVGGRLFYYREQAKSRMSSSPGALADIQSAICLNPGDPTYSVEEASVYIRMENYDQMLRSLENALRVALDFASCYCLRGICYVRQGKKAEACEAFSKAKELGDPVVDKLIKEYCKQRCTRAGMYVYLPGYRSISARM